MEDAHAKVRRLAPSASEEKLPEALGVEKRSWLGRSVSHLIGRSTEVDEAVELLEEFIWSGDFSYVDREGLRALRSVSDRWALGVDQRAHLQWASDRALGKVSPPRRSTRKAARACSPNAGGQRGAQRGVELSRDRGDFRVSPPLH
jgi:hypothetical protein